MGKVSLIQIAHGNSVWLLRLGRITNSTFPSSLKIERDYGLVSNLSKGAFDFLASYCKSKGVTRTSRDSLAAVICTKVLKINLPKDESIARISDWERQQLSESQKTYAANDAYVALEIHHELSNMPDKNFPVDLNFISHTIGSSYVSIHESQLSNRPLAYGVLEEENKTKAKAWSNAVINVTKVCVPRAFIDGSNKSLESFGSTPFRISIDLSEYKLKTAKEPTQDEPLESDYYDKVNQLNSSASVHTRVFKDVFHLMDMVPIHWIMECPKNLCESFEMLFSLTIFARIWTAYQVVIETK
ncbi:hypothetical protein [Parasitella parasitica]|uniref:3'-5' exonuclease domain-containing protein n=1 Tax=Parasitella parasitica TaxID=35722 RepID=A0A0B7MTJ7_9FUNG|nr:hypothetical protein [Parasitella parasitica]